MPLIFMGHHSRWVTPVTQRNPLDKAPALPRLLFSNDSGHSKGTFLYFRMRQIFWIAGKEFVRGKSRSVASSKERNPTRVGSVSMDERALPASATEQHFYPRQPPGERVFATLKG